MKIVFGGLLGVGSVWGRQVRANMDHFLFLWWKSAPKGYQQNKKEQCSEKVGSGKPGATRITRPGLFLQIYVETRQKSIPEEKRKENYL